MGPTHIFIEANTAGRDFVIGDLHGMLPTLKKALKNIGFDKKKDRLFSVGDLIDRGPDSLGSLKLLEKRWFYGVRGNHEDLMLDAALGHDRAMWLANGGEWANDLKKKDLVLWAKKVRDRMPIAMTISLPDGRNVGLTHGQYPFSNWKKVQKGKLNQKDLASLVWGRKTLNRGKPRKVKNIDLTIHGHTPIHRPKQLGNALFIDTGCVYGGDLTLLEMQSLLPNALT